MRHHMQDRTLEGLWMRANGNVAANKKTYDMSVLGGKSNAHFQNQASPSFLLNVKHHERQLADFSSTLVPDFPQTFDRYREARMGRRNVQF